MRRLHWLGSMMPFSTFQWSFPAMKKDEVINSRDLARYDRIKMGGPFQNPMSLKTLAGLGKSGCGKSIMASIVSGHLDRTAHGHPKKQSMPLGRHVQIVFQEPDGSFNLRKKGQSHRKSHCRPTPGPSHGYFRGCHLHPKKANRRLLYGRQVACHHAESVAKIDG